MRVIERRIDVELISRQAFGAFLKAKGQLGRPISYQELAQAATNQMRLRGIKNRSVSKSTIGHLMTGHIKGTNPDTAKAICEALDVPLGALFVQRVSTVQRDIPGRAA